jgi:glycine betaine/proline transport system substrate-binding protein
MIGKRLIAGIVLGALAVVSPIAGQEGITVLDGAQDQATAPAAPCGTTPISIARFQWPSAAILAEIHALLLTEHFGCDARVVAGDMSTTGSSMATTGEPAIAPELWVTRIAAVWNQAIEAQTVRPAANAYTSETFEGWFVPDYVAAGLVEPTLAALMASPFLGGEGEASTTDAEDAGEDETEAEPPEGAEPAPEAVIPAEPLTFISCPPDWGCSVINTNLIAAHGLTDKIDLVQPANRFEMDTLISEAVSRSAPFIVYYWQPNAVLAQFDFVSLGLGDYDAEAMACLAQASCASPTPSAFPPETVVTAVAERIFTDLPEIAGYLTRASMPLDEMDQLLGALNSADASPASVAAQFVAERGEIWGPWVGESTP